MRFDSIRARLVDLASRWERPRGLAARGLAVLFFAVIAIQSYVKILDTSYPVKDWLFWRIATMWGWGLVLSLACVSAGYVILTRAFRIDDRPPLETVVTSAAVGLVAFVLGMYAGGFLHLYKPAFAVILPAVMIASGARPLLAYARRERAAWAERKDERDPLRSVITTLAWIFGIVGVTFVYLETMTPASINFDSSWSHIPIAQDYARAGRIIRFDADYTRNFPHFASFVHTWAFIVPYWMLRTAPLRWMLCQHLEFFFFLWTLAGVGAMARWLLGDDRTRGTWAAFFLFPAIFVYDSNLGGGADHYLAFFAPPLFLAAVRAIERFEVRRSVLTGVFAAAALLTKYQAVYLVAGVGTIVAGGWIALAGRKLLRLRAERAGTVPEGAPELPSWRDLLVGPLALVGATIVVTSPHFLKNWAFYNNPFYPFLQDVFRHSRPTTHNANYLFEWLFKDYNWRPHGTLKENLKDALKLSFQFSYVPHYSFTKDVPNTGSLFTLCMPFVLFLRSPRRIWLGAIASVGCVVTWAMIFRVDRHLQTFMPLLAATTAAMVVRTWELGWAARAGLAPLVLLQVIWGGDAMFYSSFGKLNASIDMIRGGYEGKRENRFAFRPEFTAIRDSLPMNAKVVLHNYRPNLGIDRDILLDWPGQQGLILYEGIKGPRGLWEYWRSLGVTHLLYIPGHRMTVTKQDDILFNDFVSRFGQDRRHFSGMELVTLPQNPPPPDQPYKVLAIGLAGYRDGLYPVEAMKVYEAVPENKERFPRPEVPMPKEPVQQRALAMKADALCMAMRARPDPVLKSYLDSSFLTAMTYSKSFSIHIRRAGIPTQVKPGAPPAEHPTPHPEEAPGGGKGGE